MAGVFSQVFNPEVFNVGPFVPVPTFPSGQFVQVTYIQPPPEDAFNEIIANQAYLTVVPVSLYRIDNPGVIPPPVSDVFYRVPDPWTANPNLTQVYPVNSPPNP